MIDKSTNSSEEQHSEFLTVDNKNITLILGDCIQEMQKMEQNKINCIITSPPYNVDLGKNKYNKNGYNNYNDNLPYNEYLKWMKEVFQQCYKVLAEDGRLCVNIGDGKNGKIATHSDFIQICKEIGFIPLTTIIWNKNNTSNRCAWGSFMSATAPSFPRPFEYVLVFGKTDKLQHKGTNTITKDEWIEYSNGLWTFAPEKQQKKIGHPAMFPVELPYRLIQMLTFKEDTILDIFCGAGTTALASMKSGRKFIGIELDDKYFNIAQNRIKEHEQHSTIQRGLFD